MSHLATVHGTAVAPTLPDELKGSAKASAPTWRVPFMRHFCAERSTSSRPLQSKCTGNRRHTKRTIHAARCVGWDAWIRHVPPTLDASRHKARLHFVEHVRSWIETQVLGSRSHGIDPTRRPARSCSDTCGISSEMTSRHFSPVSGMSSATSMRRPDVTMARGPIRMPPSKWPLAPPNSPMRLKSPLRLSRRAARGPDAVHDRRRLITLDVINVLL